MPLDLPLPQATLQTVPESTPCTEPSTMPVLMLWSGHGGEGALMPDCSADCYAQCYAAHIIRLLEFIQDEFIDYARLR
jgi:hypothetical protein